VRGKTLRAPQIAAILDAERSLFLVRRRARKLGAAIVLVVVGVVLGDQAPALERLRRPAHAAENPVDALPAVAEREVELAEALRNHAIRRAEEAGAPRDVLHSDRHRRPPAAFGQQPHLGVERLVSIIAEVRVGPVRKSRYVVDARIAERALEPRKHGDA
jgi:hypothetical protein